MEKAAVQGYVGDTADISVDVHRMLETMDGIDFLALTLRGGAGITLPLAQHFEHFGARDRDDCVSRAATGRQRTPRCPRSRARPPPGLGATLLNNTLSALRDRRPPGEPG